MPEPAKRHDVHVVPKYGKPHVDSSECWCKPVKDAVIANRQPNGTQLWVHNPGS